MGRQVIAEISKNGFIEPTKKTTMKNLFTLFAFALIATCAFAQTSQEYNAEVEKSIQLQHLKRNFAESLKMSYTQNNLPVDDMDATCNEIADVVIPYMTQAIIELYKEHYTLDEIKEMNKYLSSPVGQKGIMLTPIASQVGGAVVQKLEVLSQIQQIVAKHLKD